MTETIASFHELGVPLKEEPTAKLFPRSDRSRDVLDALLGALSSLDVTLSPSTRVHRIEPVHGGFELDTSRGPRAAAEGLARRASAVALAVAIVLAAACNRDTSTPVRVIDLLTQVDHAELRPGEGAFTVVQHTCGGDSRPSLSVPPVSRATWHTTLPERGRLVTAAALTGGTDASASFRIGISDDRTYEALLVRPVAAAACSDGWIPMEVDLSRYAGRKLSLFYRPWKTAWRVIFSVTQDAGAPAQAFWAMPAIDADRESARAFFETQRK